MTYVVLKGYLYDPIWFDRLLKARGSNGTGESIQKRQFFSILLVLVSDPGSVSPFFRDSLLARVLHFVSVDRGERGLRGKRIVTWEKQGGQPFSNIQHGFWQCNVVGLSCRSEWIILSTEVNLCPLGKRIASYKFCLGRTRISITMKFINEVVNPISDRNSWQLNPIFPIILLSVIVRKEGPTPSCSRIVALSFSTLCLRIS